MLKWRCIILLKILNPSFMLLYARPWRQIQITDTFFTNRVFFHIQCFPEINSAVAIKNLG